MQRNISKSSTLVRGGQTTQHWSRMAAQVLRYASVIAATVYVLCFVWLVQKEHDWNEMRIAIYYEMAERGIVTNSGFVKNYSFVDLSGNNVTMAAEELFRNQQYRGLRDEFFHRFQSSSMWSLIPAVLSAVFALVVFQITGNKVQDDEHIRGTRLITEDRLKAWSIQRWKEYGKQFKDRKSAPVYSIAGIPFPPNALEAQTGLFGTVGVGKTNGIIELLMTVRSLGGRAVVYDRMGTFVSKFYDEETDVIINPFDNRSHSWCVFDDVYDVASFTQIAEVMIPNRPNAGGDPFWSQAARIVFEYAARSLFQKGPRTNKALRDSILNIPADQLASLIKSTPGAHFFNESIEKTAQSIRANLIAEMRLLEFLRSDGPRFSVREWMKSDEPSVLFLTGDAEHAAATRNLISVLLEIGANALMSGPKSNDPRVFFIMDEVPTLNRLPFLVSSLAEIRQFGGAFVLGYQVYSQLEDIYGKEAAQSITGTINNRIVFNTPDFRTAKLFSESLGSEDILEKRANITVGAHEARDGVGFMQNRVERPIVTPSEIQALPQFQAYIRFAYDAPTARVEFKPVSCEDKVAGFQPYLGDGFEDVFGPSNPGGSGATKNALKVDHKALFADFVKWCVHEFSVPEADWMRKCSAPPSDLAVYWDHFAEQRLAGAKIKSIRPFIDLGASMISNHERPKENNTNPRIAPPWKHRRVPVGTVADQEPPAPAPAPAPALSIVADDKKTNDSRTVQVGGLRPFTPSESVAAGQNDAWLHEDEMGTA